MLRFATRLAPVAGRALSPADAERRFVLSYFLADDTLSVFEPPVRNSGIVGGRYLERTRVAHVLPASLFVGARLHILQRCAELEYCDMISDTINTFWATVGSVVRKGWGKKAENAENRTMLSRCLQYASHCTQRLRADGC